MVTGTDYEGIVDRPLFGETRHKVNTMKKSVVIEYDMFLLLGSSFIFNCYNNQHYFRRCKYIFFYCISIIFSLFEFLDDFCQYIFLRVFQSSLCLSNSLSISSTRLAYMFGKILNISIYRRLIIHLFDQGILVSIR